MADNLKDYLQSAKCKGFQPIPQDFAKGDFLTHYFKDARCHSKRVDDLLTVYLADDTGELVGCKIKGVKHILRNAGQFGVLVKTKFVHLGLFFFVGAASSKDHVQHAWYAELGKRAGDVQLDSSLVVFA